MKAKQTEKLDADGDPWLEDCAECTQLAYAKKFCTWAADGEYHAVKKMKSRDGEPIFVETYCGLRIDLVTSVGKPAPRSMRTG